MGDFILEPRGPFTLASAARFVAGRPPAPKGEPKLERAVQERYGAPLQSVAANSKPFRTWLSVLMRSNA